MPTQPESYSSLPDTLIRIEFGGMAVEVPLRALAHAIRGLPREDKEKLRRYVGFSDEVFEDGVPEGGIWFASGLGNINLDTRKLWVNGTEFGYTANATRMMGVMAVLATSLDKIVSTEELVHRQFGSEPRTREEADKLTKLTQNAISRWRLQMESAVPKLGSRDYGALQSAADGYVLVSELGWLDLEEIKAAESGK